MLDVVPADAGGPQRGLRARIVSGSSWTLVTRLAAMVSVLVANGLAARELSQSDFGVYTLATSVVTTAAIFAHFGLADTVIRLVSEALALGQPGRARGAIRTVVRLNVAGGLVVGGALAIFGGRLIAHDLFHSRPLALAMVTIGAWAAAEGIRFPISEAFRGLHDIRLASLLGDPCRSVLLAVAFGVLAVVSHTTTLTVAIAVSLAASTITMALAGLVLRLRVQQFGVRARNVGYGFVLAIAVPLTLTDLTGLIVAQGDNWVVGAFRSAKDVAVYGAAGRLDGILALPLFVMNGVIAPLIAELWAQGKRVQLETMVRGATTLATIPCLIGWVAFAVAGGRLMRAAYGGNGYARGGHIVAILAFGTMLGVAAGPNTFALIMTGNHRLAAAAAALTVVVTVGGEIVGVHVAGLTGVAVASAAGVGVQNVLLTFAARRRLGIWTHASISPRRVRAFLQLRD